ncbi:MAG: hypothetical protein WKF87_21830 [Chryseolinea sp.]
MDFEAYLISKRIDTIAFANAEHATWLTWKTEFEQIHPNSFTAQKLYLINPVRRKYPLKFVSLPKPEAAKPSAAVPQSEPSAIAQVSSTKPAVPRPVFKPKPKLS